MINAKLRENISQTYDGVLFFDNPSYDNSIIGISQDDRLIYDMNKMIDELMKDDSIDNEIDAIEFIEYNTIRAYLIFIEHRL